MPDFELIEKKVFLYEEAKTVDNFTMFGWELVKREILVNNMIAALCRVELTFERDTSMNNYNRIVELERIYNSISEPTLILYRPSSLLLFCCFLSIIFGAMLWVLAVDLEWKLLMLVGMLITFSGVLVTPFKLYRYVKLKSDYNEELFKYFICLEVFKAKEIEISKKVKTLI